jgi:hypothetical protein
MNNRQQGRGGRTNSDSRNQRDRTRQGRPPQQPTSVKFKGNCTDLAGYIFDCSDYKQADNYVTTVKRISEYIGSEYKHGGDIRSSIINEALYAIPLPLPATPNAIPDAPTPAETMAQLIFKGEVDSYIKRRSVLKDNIQKAYSLVLGQCTELLQSKLKQQATWAQVHTDQDVVALLALIKAITFRLTKSSFPWLCTRLKQASTI